MGSKLLRTFCAISIALLAFSACTTLKRYRSAKYIGVDNSLASMDLFRSRVDPPEKKDPAVSLWQLSAQGQAALIKTLDTRNKDDEKFNKAINGKYLSKDDDSGIADYISKDVQMVFTIARTLSFDQLGQPNTKFSPADRLENIDFTLTIPKETPLHFTKWNKYVTQYGTIDIGDVSFSQSLSVSAGIGDTAVAGIGAQGALSRTESQHLKYRYIQLNGTIDDKNLHVTEQGQREIDLTGNVIANVSYKFDPFLMQLFSISSLQDDDGKYNPTTKLTLKASEANIPDLANIPEKITGTLGLKYTYRHVKNNSGIKTFYEWDDRVEYYTGTYQKDVVLFEKKDFLPSFFFVGKIGQDAVAMASRSRLKLVNPGGKSYLLLFPTPSQARAFCDWLVNYTCPVTDNSKPLVIGGYTLTASEGGAEVPVTKTLIDNIKSSISPLPYFH